MEGLDLSKIDTFICEGVDMPKERAVQIWKLTYKTIEEFVKEVVTPNPALTQILDYVSEKWNEVEDITFEDCFKERNIEIRRLLFRGIGMDVMMEKLKPELLGEEKLVHPNVKWDENNVPVSNNDNEEIYQLYRIDGSKFYSEEELEGKNEWDMRRIMRDTIYAVRCWCVSTGREYWIYVPEHACKSYDPIEAIAWTVRLNITDPEFIMRQGDVIIAKKSVNSKECSEYHLDKKTYSELLIAAS